MLDEFWRCCRSWEKFPFQERDSKQNVEETIFHKITKRLYHSGRAWRWANESVLVFTK